MTARSWMVLVLSTGFALACTGGEGGDAATPGDGHTPVQVGSQGKDGVINPGSVTSPDAPGAGITDADCQSMTDGGALAAGSDCITAEIHCGDTIKGHTRGGVEKFDSKFYESAFCTPATTSHKTGDERVYLLDLKDPQMRAIVYLDTPCANLDLAAMKYNGATCPSSASDVLQCEMNVQDGTKREKVDLFNNDPTKWWIVVEGRDDEEGAFALTVQCEKWGTQ